MLFRAGIEAALQARNQPVITALDLHRLAQALFLARRWRGEPLQRLPQAWDERRTATLISHLIRSDALSADRDFAPGVYRVLEIEAPETAEQLACLVDPFCYVSYRSALHMHRLIGERPSPLHLSTPEAKLWKARHAELMAGLEPDAEGLGPSYGRISIGGKIRRRAVLLHETSTPTPVVEIDQARVSAIGPTFVDTLTEPGRCGGMAAVLKVWNRHARQHAPEIVEALDRSASKMVKVRAGYIFTERLAIETPAIAAWQAFAQRGGSRRLDPEQPYAPTFSERWMISLNVEATR